MAGKIDRGQAVTILITSSNQGELTEHGLNRSVSHIRHRATSWFNLLV